MILRNRGRYDLKPNVFVWQVSDFGKENTPYRFDPIGVEEA